MLTCCPGCITTFRVTPEQLKLRAGKVRCGKCQTVFNALDSLVEAAAITTPAEPAVHVPSMPHALSDVTTTIAAASDAPDETPLESSAPADTEQTEPASPEEIRGSAVAAGLVAARETTEIPGYNKWAEGAFTTSVSVSVPTSRPAWPFVLVALLLLTALAAQVAHYFRAELAVSSPVLRPILESACAALDCEIPLPRHVDLVSIEASDLQVDPAQGGALALMATLKNRAPYAQAWPLLEITLTDVQDSAVLRRVLQPAEYLPPKADPTLFPPNGEAAVHLWLEAKGIAAAGYRLYVFYP